MTPARLVAVGLLGLSLTGCYQEMADHAGYKPLRPTSFFPDGRSARPLIAGTVARGQLETNTALYQGREDGELVSEFPFAMTREVLDRGQQRFNIYCSMCHGLTGHGDGRIVQRGFTPPPNYITDLSRAYKLKGKDIKLIDVPVGHIYDVITHGYGAMASYSEQVPVKDRWAIVGYVRALQFSQSAELRKKLQANKAGAKDAKKEAAK